MARAWLLAECLVLNDGGLRDVSGISLHRSPRRSPFPRTLTFSIQIQVVLRIPRYLWLTE